MNKTFSVIDRNSILNIFEKEVLGKSDRLVIYWVDALGTEGLRE